MQAENEMWLDEEFKILRVKFEGGIVINEHKN